MRAAGRHVIIIGGGASGALLAVSLLRKAADTSVTIVEPRALLARGFAYGEASPFHLLNVRAANMSAYQDVPNHFLEWLDRNSITAGVTGEGRFRFVPRRTYGEYLAQQLGELGSTPAARAGLQHVRGEATSIKHSASGLIVELADGRRIAGDAAVLATGYALRQASDLPCRLAPWTAWQPGALTGMEHVLILGTGHSAIDHVQLLVAAGYGGKITLMSRHGFLPAVHRPVEPANIEAGAVPFGARFSHVWRWFRNRVGEAERRGGDWRSVLDGLRPHAQALWQSLPVEEQLRFIRHARAWYDVRRHRLAPSITATLERLRADGRLEVVAARLQSVRDLGGAAEVVYRRRGERQDSVMTVQGIIECTGFDLDPRSARNPILADLLARGLAQRGAHGFGLKVSANCALIDADGHASKDLFAVGPLTRGQFWEVVGLPDIRQQCAELARTLLHHTERV